MTPDHAYEIALISASRDQRARMDRMREALIAKGRANGGTNGELDSDVIDETLRRCYSH